jgi:hypothetical protein
MGKSGGQALEAQRAPAFSFDPNELTIITDKNDPLYDHREALDVPRELVLDVAARGVFQAIGVRRRDGESVVLFGKQRTKAAAVANALGAGVEYSGSLKAVKAAIAEMGADEKFSDRVKALMKGKAIRVPALARNSGEDVDARMMMRAENSHRRGDATLERIKAAQVAVEKHGDSPEDIAQAENVDVKTVRRWLAMDVSGGPKKARRTRAKGPGKVAIRKWFCRQELGADYKTLFGYLLGENTREEALHENPDLKDII